MMSPSYHDFFLFGAIGLIVIPLLYLLACRPLEGLPHSPDQESPENVVLTGIFHAVVQDLQALLLSSTPAHSSDGRLLFLVEIPLGSWTCLNPFEIENTLNHFFKKGKVLWNGTVEWITHNTLVWTGTDIEIHCFNDSLSPTPHWKIPLKRLNELILLEDSD